MCANTFFICLSMAQANWVHLKGATLSNYTCILKGFVFLGLCAELLLTRSLREPGGPCTKSMEVPESCMEWVKGKHRMI